MPDEQLRTKFLARNVRRDDFGTDRRYNGRAMNALAHALRRSFPRGWARSTRAATPAAEASPVVTQPAVDLAPNDPLLAYLQSVGGAVDLETLKLQSAGLEELRRAHVRLVVPLIAQGELIGILNLGPRLSDQDYSGDDRRLLEHLATQAAPSVRVAQLVREQQAEAMARERIAQELRVAHLIQQHFLPDAVPQLRGWDLAAYYRPAREVGGDFYDFVPLENGRLGILIADVTDKGVPAAMVMAAARSLLRASAQRLVSPGQVLERVNEQLCPTMPPNMFVTCLYGVLNPCSGQLVYANAGHDAPYVHCRDGGVSEMRARGMPLGLMEGMRYEEKELCLGPGDQVLFHSDGLAEAHNPGREMFGFPRVKALVAESSGDGEALLARLLDELERFTGPGWQQEDDVTLLTLRRVPVDPSHAGSTEPRLLADFALPSAPGNEREAIDRVTAAVAPLAIAPARLERLKTAVGEATMNAIEHGNANCPDRPVTVQVDMCGECLRVRITDQGTGASIPELDTPDLQAKLAGLQTPRGWGMFLIKNMVDEVRDSTDADRHTLELIIHLEGGAEGGKS
jgi:serine phosphatase RsbU (regulator of sigma subunit)/anti-sigma regulatory factor (Ser/Thr protein kinase)